MPRYWRHSFTGLGAHVQPLIKDLNGGKLMRRAPVEALLRAQDFVAALARRIVATGGIRGSETWRTPDSDPAAAPFSHPARSDRRVIGQGSVDLTPGCFLRLWAVAVPSGQTQAGGINQYADGVHGRVEVDVLWTDHEGSTTTTTHGAQLPASAEEHGAEPASMWSALHEIELEKICPAGLEDTATLRRWSRHTHVDVTIYAVGGARIVDACVFELPSAVAFEADDAGDLWTSHLYAPGSPHGPAQPLSHPYTRFSEASPDGDPRGGVLHLLDVHHAQHRRLGPVLFAWCAAQESTGAETITTASASLVALEGGGSVVFDLTEPGLSCGTGGYARRHTSNSPFVLRDRVAAIPVIVRVRASSGTTGLVRVQTGASSYVDVTITGGSLAWHRVAGWLEVGLAPDDTTALLVQLWHHTSTVQSVTVHYAGGYVPADA